MQVFNFPEKIKLKQPTFILGGFETIHRGHELLIKTAKDISKGDIVLVLIRNIEAIPHKNKILLEQLDIRLQKIASLGVKYVMALTFNDKLQNTPAKELIDQFIKLYDVKKIIVGKDYKFGKNAEWDALKLQNYFSETDIVATLKITEAKISTSLIKEQISFGDVQFANSLLVSDWAVNIQVQMKNNLAWPQNILKPHSGVYAIYFNDYQNSLQYFGLLSFDLEGFVKIKLIDSNIDLQNMNGTIIFKKRIRFIIKKADTLITNFDLETAKNYFAKIR